MFENNISIIKNTRPRLAEIYNYENKNEENLIAVETLIAKDETEILTIKKEGIQYRLNSIYNPKLEAEKWLEQFSFFNHQCVISLFGFGNGLIVRKLIDKLNDSDILAIYEPSIEVFLHVIKSYDISDILLNDKVSITVEGINDYEYHAVIRDHVDWVNVYSQIVCSHPIYDKIFSNEYRDFLKEISDNNLRAILNRNTAAHMGIPMIRNVVQNLQYLEQSNIVLDLYDSIPKEIPVIIVSAGPSLDKNINDLNYAKGKSIIIATDRVLDILLDKDIEPDFIITLDAIKPLRYFSRRDNIQIPLFTKLESNQEILSFHKGRKIWYDAHEFLNNLYEKLDKNLAYFNSGGSVSTAAFSVCVALGMKTVILIGQDLAYSGEFTHVGGEKGVGEAETNIVGMVEDIYGNMVPIRHDWKIFLTWFEDAISQREEMCVIDATEGGAKIKGTRIMTLKDAINEYCTKEFNCKNILDRIPYTIQKSEMAVVKEYIEQCITDLDTIQNESEAAKRFCQQIIMSYTSNQNKNNYVQNLVKKIEKINMKITEIPANLLVDTYVAQASAENLSNIFQFTGKIEDDRLVTFRKAELMYKAMEDASIEIKRLFISNFNKF